MDLWKALRIVRGRKWAFILGTLVALLAVGLTSDNAIPKPVYKSSAKLLLTPPNSPAVAEAAAANGGPALRTWFADQSLLKELILSQELMGRVGSRLGLGDKGNSLRGNVTLDPLAQAAGQVTLLSLSVTAGNPKDSQRYTTALVEEFISYVEELSAREYARTRQFLEEMVAESQAKLAKTEAEILKWQDEHEAISVDQALAAVADRENALETEQNELQAQAAGLKAELAQLQDFTTGKTTVPPWAVLGQGKTSISGLEANVTQQRLKLAELRQVFTDENQQVKDQTQRLKTAEAMYLKELNATVASYLKEKQSGVDRVMAALKTIDGQLLELRKKKDIGDQRLALARKQRQLAMYEENYNTLMTQLYKARVAEQGSRRSGAISMLEAPGPGHATFVAVRPNNVKRTLMAVPFCLIFGFTLALMLDYLSSSMKMRPRIEETLDLPVLGSIPRLPIEMAEEWEALKKTAYRELVVAGRSNGNGNGHYHRNGNGNGNGNGHYRNGNGNGRHNGNGKHHGRSNGNGKH